MTTKTTIREALNHHLILHSSVELDLLRNTDEEDMDSTIEILRRERRDDRSAVVYVIAYCGRVAIGTNGDVLWADLACRPDGTAYVTLDKDTEHERDVTLGEIVTRGAEVL